jgi:hypothetical protein
MRGLMGSFAVLPLPDLLDLLGRRQVSGSLTCERGTVRKTLHLAPAGAVGAASNDPREYLGQLLINFGHITEDQLQKAFQTQEETKIRLGKVLTMVGLVTPETVRDALAIKIRETILDVFLWDSGLFYFDDVPPAAVDELDTTVPLADIVKEAEFRATAWNAFRGEFPSGVATLEVDLTRTPASMGPSTVDGRLLQLAAEGKTIDEIGLALHATDFHLYQRLYALARQGLVRASGPRGGVSGATESGLASADLVDRARGLLADGRPEDAEMVAAKALELAPGSEVARSLLVEAERLLARRLHQELLEPPRLVRLKVAPGEVGKLQLSSADKYLLSRCDGRRTILQIAQVAPIKELEVLKSLRRFADNDIIELRLEE